ncbi:MAG: respiratory-chain dehydrogenase 24 Kd subunit [Herbaspirillum sp.]|jgi:formate dehydrogenase subunit gamma|nr:respiratory-chain dehydrogenase 24 Kd subunit [Herbaspirillum sp.]
MAKMSGIHQLNAGDPLMNMQQPVDMAAVESLIQRHRTQPGPLLPLLHAIQDTVGYVPDEVVPAIALGLNLSRAEVHGVISYYHHFRRYPAGKHVLQICRAEACQALGSDALVAHAQAALGCDFHETSSDGNFTLEPVYCLGQCACGPNIMLDDRLHARVSDDKLNRLLDAKRGAQ